MARAPSSDLNFLHNRSTIDHFVTPHTTTSRGRTSRWLGLTIEAPLHIIQFDGDSSTKQTLPAPSYNKHPGAMASNFSSRAIHRLASSQFRQPTLRLGVSPRCLQTCRQYSAEASPTPPLLAKFKTDLKTAMRAKDAARLSVLRTILSATNNAAKTSSPIKTDVQLVQLLRKTARGNQEAAEEARAAGREDLIAKEEAQVKIIDEYIADSGVQTLGKDEIRAIVEKVISEVKNEGVDEKRISGELFKRLMVKDGPLEGKEVDRTEIAQIAKELTK